MDAQRLRGLLIPFPDQPITLSASLAVLQHCLRFAFAYSIDLEMESVEIQRALPNATFAPM